MNHHKLQIYFFLILFLFFTYLALQIFAPFLGIMVLAAVFAFMLHPLYKKVLPFFAYSHSVAAALIIIFFIVIILTPLGYFSFQIFREAQTVYQHIASNNAEYLNQLSINIQNAIRYANPEFTLNLSQSADQVLSFVISSIASIATNALNIFFRLLICIVAMFFFLRDGDKMVEAIIHLSPLEKKYNQKIITTMEGMVNSVVRGTLLVAVIQGILAGIGLALFGISNSTFWGSLAILASLVPGLGTALVFVPAIIYMLVVGNIPAAIGLLIWGAIIVGLVDNFLMPYLYSWGSQIHPLFIFFSVLGGLVVFGPTGFIFGPIILSLYYALLQIYKTFILDLKEARI
jgi:predicted PurR-regulated permease PerM